MGKKHFQIKEPTKNSGSRASAADTPNYDDMPPVFSLERLQVGDYCLSTMDQEHKASFADAMFRRRQMLWRDLKQANRHGLGTEKIQKDQIKAPIPRFITDEQESFLVFRFHGKAPMVGYRVRNIFYVLWFDPTYKLYDH